MLDSHKNFQDSISIPLNNSKWFQIWVHFSNFCTHIVRISKSFTTNIIISIFRFPTLFLLQISYLLSFSIFLVRIFKTTSNPNLTHKQWPQCPISNFKHYPFTSQQNLYRLAIFIPTFQTPSVYPKPSGTIYYSSYIWRPSPTYFLFRI